MTSESSKPREVVVITGGSAGVGRATAVRFASQGAAVAVLARGEDGLAGAVKEIEAAGGTALAIPVDVADADQLEAAATQVETTLGPIDIWINNAMATVFSPFVEMRPEEFRRATEVTYLGTVYGTLAALRRMRPRRRGVIIQVGSALAYTAIPLQSAYCGAKFAIRGFTDAVRAELVHDKLPIQLTMVQLAAFNTPQFDWGRHRLPFRPQPVPPVFQPEVAAQAIEWAAHHRKRELWVGFPVVKTIVATLLLPGLVGRLAAKRGWDGQLDNDHPVAHTPQNDNLFTPLAGDHGAHGRFDQIAKSASVELWLALHWGKLAAACAVLVAIGIALALMD